MGRVQLWSRLCVGSLLVSVSLAASPRLAAAAAGPAVVHVAAYEVVVAVPLLNLRQTPAVQAPVLLRLAQGTPLAVHGYTAHWLAVTTRGGRAGYVIARDVRLPGGRLIPLHPVHPAGARGPRPAVLLVAVGAANLRTAPRLTAPVRAVLVARTRLTVRAMAGAWVEVTTASGVTGWLWRALARPA